MNELAKKMKKDGQELRPVFDYINNTFDGIKGHQFEGGTFNDRIEFVRFIKDVVCPCLINSLNEWKEEEPKEYATHNV